jgi:hypothetical protein
MDPRALSSSRPASETAPREELSVLLGLPFLAIGIGILLMVTDVVSGFPHSSSMPSWAVGIVGGVFSIAGLCYMVQGAIAIRRRKVIGASPIYRRNAPWTWDHPWDPHGSRDNRVEAFAKPLRVAFISGMLLVPFAYVFSSAKGPSSTLPRTVIGLLGLGFAALATYGLYFLAQKIRYGSSRLRFSRFPFFLGERVEFQLYPSRGFAGVEKLEATLRCIEERYNLHSQNQGSQQEITVNERWSETIEVSIPPQVEAGGIRLHFNLPDTKIPWGAISTRLSKPPRAYWTLDLSASVRGIDYASSFLIPVYEKA